MSGLKKDMGAIQRAIQMLAGTYNKDMLSFELATIKTVDTQNWQCSATLVSSDSPTEYDNIQLTSEIASNGFVLVPKVGSNVILAITWRNEVYVFMCSEVDALVFHQANGDANKTFEEFVICNNSGISLPVGIQLTDGGGNGIVINSGTAQTLTNNQGNNGIIISSGTGNVSNASNGIVMTNSSSPPSNTSNGLLITCSGTMQLNDGSFGGMVKLIDPDDTTAGVLARLNNIEQWINTFSGPSGTFAMHGHTCPPSGGVTIGPPIQTGPSPSPPPPGGAPSSVGPPTIVQTDRTMLENTDITQGPSVS